MNYETVIGLEIHIQLNTKSKTFCSCSTEFGAPPNTHTCPVCLGLPGALPVLNEEVVHKGIAAGLALNAQVENRSVFARKNYFYPDLPKAYQISQYELPINTGGQVRIITTEGNEKWIGITRAHLEEDAGKLVRQRDVTGLAIEAFEQRFVFRQYEQVLVESGAHEGQRPILVRRQRVDVRRYVEGHAGGGDTCLPFLSRCAVLSGLHSRCHLSTLSRWRGGPRRNGLR